MGFCCRMSQAECMLEVEALKLLATPEKGEVSAVLSRPPDPRALLVLGHGAGSHLESPLVVELSLALHRAGVATFRFNYPYSERGRGMDAEPVRLATVRSAVAAARERARSLPVFGGGHSMSGRMMSLACSKAELPGLRGIVFFAFPLYSGAPNLARAKHLAEVDLPMLFVSGSRDKMADPERLTQVAGGLTGARLHFLETADHGFKVQKRRSTTEPVLEEAARVTREWIDSIL
jgi:predicted alpha/beta-hydrolase family hydrolase